MNATALDRLRPTPPLFARAARSVWRFLVAVGSCRAREQMLVEARRIESSRPELAAALRRAARDVWHAG